METNNKIAILIDAENISYKNTKQIIDTMADKGKVLVKMVVADWTKITSAKTQALAKHHYREKQIEGWRKEASKHSMTAVQQFSYVAGKNTSDIALTIQAMKILYEKPYITSFCLVSNDSDFTRLAQELREQNKEVVGMGERAKAIPEFVNAFSEFVYLGESIEEDAAAETATAEVPAPTQAQVAKTEATEKKATAQPKKKSTRKKTAEKPAQPECPIDAEKMDALKKIIEAAIEESDTGVAFYSQIADRMKKQFSDFIPANYECKNTSSLIAKLLPFLPQYKEQKQPIPNNPNGFVMMLVKR